MDGWGANHEGTEAVMQAKARAGGETNVADPTDGLMMRVTRSLFWSLVLIATLAGVVWAFGGTPASIVAVVIATVGALLLVFGWRLLRSVRRGSAPTEDH
jgi:protein-S-isoprenylcysteine O-methyltransferase Ste14